MRASPIIVNWHAENAPIYSADFQPHGKGRLATGGGDNNVRVSGVFFLHGNRILTQSSYGKLTPMGKIVKSTIYAL